MSGQQSLASNYAEGAASNYFVRASSGGPPLVVNWWKGTGSPIDFTNPDAALWAQNTKRDPWVWFFAGVFFSVVAVLVVLVKNSDDQKSPAQLSSRPKILLAILLGLLVLMFVMFIFQSR